MKKTISSVRKFALAGAFVLGLGTLLTSCLKDHDDTIDNNTNNAAGLMAFNLATDQTSVGFSLDNNNLNSTALGFNNYTGVYLAVYPGTRKIEAFDFFTGDSLATSSASFELGKYYSLFLVGSDSSLENLVVQDNVDSLSSATQAFVRYINAIPDASSPTVTVSANGSNVVSEGASFKTVSGFVAVNPGDVSVTVSNGGSISANRTISLEAKKVYTILLIGEPGAAGDKAVQVKYIANGTVDDSSAARISKAAANRAIN